MKNFAHIAIAWAIFGQCCSMASGAVVVELHQDRPDFPPRIEIVGKITARDVATVEQALSASVAKNPSNRFEVDVYLDSSGGDIDSAMRIGRLLKARTSNILVKSSGWEKIVEHAQGTTYFPKKAVCASACVLILASGSERLASDRVVGIHRPYSVQVKFKDQRDTISKYNETVSRVKSYLDEMGMSPLLIQEMMRVRAETIRWLTLSEMDRYGLIGTDPAFEDAQDSKAAARRGIDKREWLRRKQLYSAMCPAPPQGSPLGGAAYIRWGECFKAVYDSGVAPR